MPYYIAQVKIGKEAEIEQHLYNSSIYEDVCFYVKHIWLPVDRDQKKLFPGYLFFDIIDKEVEVCGRLEAHENYLYRFMKETKVSKGKSLLNKKNKVVFYPYRLTQEEEQHILKLERESRESKLDKKDLVIGSFIKAKRGALAGFSGKVIYLSHKKDQVNVSFNIMGRQVLVHKIATSDLELLIN